MTDNWDNVACNVKNTFNKLGVIKRAEKVSWWGN